MKTDKAKGSLRVLSWNVNGFAGLGNKNTDLCNKQNEVLNKLAEIEDIDVIFLSEFNVHTRAGEEVMEVLKNKGYQILLPNTKEKVDEIGCNITSIVIGFTKVSTESLKSLGLTLKWNEIIYNNYRIIGVHIPSRHEEKPRWEGFWNDIISHFDKHKDEKVIYIGDMNVFEDNTPTKKKYKKLLQTGVVDAWIHQEGTHEGKDSLTYKGVTRLDYALLSPSAAEELLDMRNLQECYKNGASDHSAIMIDLKMEKV